jgi:DNA replication and repair protein RecF
VTGVQTCALPISNFLEALYFCSYASSFRGVKDSELICTGKKDCSVAAVLEGAFPVELTVMLKDGKKIVILDGKKTEDRKELLGTSPCIVFCHEDLEFIAGPPERRRWFFDQTQSLYDPLYLEDLRKFKKILKTRNSLIKENRGRLPLSYETSSIFASLEIQMVQYGMELMAKRREAAAEFSRIFEPLYQEISGIDGITIRYQASWKESGRDEIAARLAKHRDADFALGVSLSGPHRDRYVFIRKGDEFSSKASTGQRRLLALLLRVAQAREFFEKTGKAPVLLLDDVLLELDGEKRRKFLSFMPRYDQAFYTFLPEEPFGQYQKSDTMVYHVREGALAGENL